MNIQLNTQSFTFPPDVGYALNAHYYLMETHYIDMEPPKDLESLHITPPADNSGLKFYYTSELRKHDAGVLSIGKLTLQSPNRPNMHKYVIHIELSAKTDRYYIFERPPFSLSI